LTHGNYFLLNALLFIKRQFPLQPILDSPTLPLNAESPPSDRIIITADDLASELDPKQIKLEFVDFYV
jgi:hypothetical protein